MNQMIQLGYILILLVGIFGFAMQSMVQVKNLAVTNQLVKGKSTTIFLAIIVLFNGCDFLALFLGNTIGQQGILWILVAENILEILLAYALIEMERNYAMAERNKRCV